MTKAEQIARELISKFTYIEYEYSCPVDAGDGCMEDMYNTEYLNEESAKQCALITVNHILEMLNVNEKVESVETYRHKLYTEVKQILEK